jgi:putative protease
VSGKIDEKVPELLAPVGSKEALAAAINAGADAVYLSGKQFGARMYAANFDQSELEEAIGYAHARGVSVYVTVNTLITEGEIPEASEYLVWLYEIGADAVLIQDVGLVSLARELVPALELHASTQMTIHNKEGAAWAARMGLKRVVLARELILSEIEEIAESVPEIGLEVFVHGALCYCYSGQCLLSSLIGGRSGNRGLCAQPCRKPYDLVQGERDDFGRYMELVRVPLTDRYLLSTRDLSLYSHLDRIVQAPLEAIKIEGRMKSPQYVAIVVSIYRKALDAISRGEWSPSKEDLRDLLLAFNRGFTDGYILGARQEKLMGRESSGNRGVFIGQVISYDHRKSVATVKLAGDHLPERGDGIVFRLADKEQGMIVRSFRKTNEDVILLPVKSPVEPGASIWLTRKKALAKKVEKMLSRPRSFVPVDLLVTWQDKTPVLEGWLTARKTKPLKITMPGQFRMEPARRSPLTKEQIEAQLCKTGTSPFYIRKLEVEYPGGLFAPIKELNELRRNFLNMAQDRLMASLRPTSEEIIAARRKQEKLAAEWGSLPDAIGRKTPSISVYANSLETVQGAAIAGCRRVYFEPLISLEKEDKCNPQECPLPALSGRDDWDLISNEILDQVFQAQGICQPNGVELVWKWPRITRQRFLDFASKKLEYASEAGVKEIMVEGIGAMKAVHNATPEMKISGSAGLNVWNSFSVRTLSPYFRQLTLSPELSAEEMAELVAGAHSKEDCPQLEIIVQGNMETIITEDYLPSAAMRPQSFSKKSFMGLRDSRRKVFPLWVNGDCRTHILNSVETCLVNHLPRILEMGIDSLAIDARERTEKYAREMVSVYNEAVKVALGCESKKDLETLKDQARKMSMGGITAGHFLSGRREEV